MHGKTTVIAGLLFILLGAILILQNFSLFDQYFLRSFGLFTLGILLFFQGVLSKPPRRVFLSSFFTLLGAYYILGELNLLSTSPGLIIPVYTIIIGLSFYPVFLIEKGKWDKVLLGNLIILVGILFLFWHLELIPNQYLINITNTYWPVILILSGLLIFMKGLRKH
ncbi:hypothetical protein AYK24_02640 [Thermoplasmatales archaeon SG8-52-4]|nr:MAG: hypothetical protein AYK24_02640 [Thermoplasmatales archaeon SG8-52-4]